MLISTLRVRTHSVPRNVRHKIVIWAQTHTAVDRVKEPIDCDSGNAPEEGGLELGPTRRSNNEMCATT